MKVPYFFYYAKDKKKEQVEKINNSTINKIVKEINENRNMFKPIKNLADINYLLLLQDKEDSYYNEELNKAFDSCNKKYGNNIVIDKEDTNKNNISAVAIEMKKELNAIEPDDKKVLNSLVKFLYGKKSTRKKKLLWYMFGEQLYINLLNNVEEQNICLQCGKRTDEELIKGRCKECRQEEIEKLGGKKIVKCVDCGVEFEVDAKDNTTCRCKECYKDYRKKKSLEKSIRYNSWEKFFKQNNYYDKLIEITEKYNDSIMLVKSSIGKTQKEELKKYSELVKAQKQWQKELKKYSELTKDLKKKIKNSMPNIDINLLK